MSEKLTTIEDYLYHVEQQFAEADLCFGHGTDNSWDEAVFLVLTIMQLPFDSGEEVLKKKPNKEQGRKILNLCQRRVEDRIPLPYLLHEAWFAGHKFYVDQRVLVPRSPLAELIENDFQPWLDASKIKTVLDLCTGGGCIGIATALQLPAAKVDAVDISEDALAVAEHNVKDFKLQDRVSLIASDGFANLVGKKYDLIISNPPYVDAEDIASMDDEFHYEPEIGLASGEDGLDFTRHILANAKQHLNAKGALVVEVGNSHYALAQAFPDLPFTWLEFERGGEGVFLLYREQLK